MHYQEPVRSLMYAALAMWPDISYAVAALCRFNSCPFTSPKTAARRVIQYLKATADFQLHFNSNGSGNINDNYSVVGFKDSDWASSSSDSQSQSGHILLMHQHCGTISWQSQQHNLIALSTVEAQYIAYSKASREARWLLHIQRYIYSSPCDQSLLPIYFENQDVLTHITTGVLRARMKHIDVCYQMSGDLYAHKIVDYSSVHMNGNAACRLANVLTKEKNTKFMKAMRLWLKDFHKDGILI